MRGACAANPYEYGTIILRIFLACVPHASLRHDAHGRPPRATAYRTEYIDDTLSALSSGNARAPCLGRSNGRSPAAGSSWPVSFSSTPPSFQEPRSQQRYYRKLWVPAREPALPLARFHRSACPAPPQRRPTGREQPPRTRRPQDETTFASKN